MLLVLLYIPDSLVLHSGRCYPVVLCHQQGRVCWPRRCPEHPMILGFPVTPLNQQIPGFLEHLRVLCHQWVQLRQHFPEAPWLLVFQQCQWRQWDQWDQWHLWAQ